MGGIIRLFLFEAYNSVVFRVLGKADGKMNEVVDEKNLLDNYGRNKWLVRPFRRQEFWKFIGCILSAVTYGKKRHKL